MRKLMIMLLSLLCCFALATTAFADVIGGPTLGSGLLIVLIGVAVLVVGGVLYLVLRKK